MQVQLLYHTRCITELELGHCIEDIMIGSYIVIVVLYGNDTSYATYWHLFFMLTYFLEWGVEIFQVVSEYFKC